MKKNSTFYILHLPAGRQGSTFPAFTLIELLISIAIVGMITVFTVVNFRENERKNELELAAEEIVAQINSAQTMSSAGRTVEFCSGGAYDGQICSGGDECPGEGVCQIGTPRGGYGINLTTGSPQFIFFADVNNNHGYDVGESLADGFKNIPTNIEISALNIRISEDAFTNLLDIVFEPPKSRVYINGNNEGQAIITLYHVVTKETKTVSIDSISGRVEMK